MKFRCFALFVLLVLPNLANAGLIKVDITFQTLNYVPLLTSEVAPVKEVSGSFSFFMNDPKLNPEFFSFYWVTKKASDVNLKINGFDYSIENTLIDITTYANKLHTIYFGGVVDQSDTNGSLTTGTNDFWLILSTSWTKDIATDASGRVAYTVPEVMDDFFESQSFYYTLSSTPVPEPSSLVLFILSSMLVFRKRLVKLRPRRHSKDNSLLVVH